jgi:hypothetical protein
MSSPESIGKTEQDQQKKRTRIGKLVSQALKGTAELIGVVFTGDDEALLGLFRKDVENPWESETGSVDTRVDGQGKLINPQVREYVKRHKLTYPESVAMGGRPPFGRYWDEKKD